MTSTSLLGSSDGEEGKKQRSKEFERFFSMKESTCNYMASTCFGKDQEKERENRKRVLDSREEGVTLALQPHVRNTSSTFSITQSNGLKTRLNSKERAQDQSNESQIKSCVTSRQEKNFQPAQELNYLLVGRIGIVGRLVQRLCNFCCPQLLLPATFVARDLCHAQLSTRVIATFGLERAGLFVVCLL